AANAPLSASYSGFVNSETSSLISGQPLLSTLADTNSPVGIYPITIAPGTLSAANYTFSLVNGSVTVTQAVLTVAADNQSRLYGTTNPVLTATITGFVNGEDTNVVSGAAELSTSADLNSPVGQYDIVVGQGTLAAANYSFSLTNGTLTVGKALLTVAAENKSRAYGAANPALTYTVSGFVEGQDSSILSGAPALSTSADASSPVGAYDISITQGTLAADNYALSFSPGTLSVSKAPLTIIAQDQSRSYGAANPALTISYSGFVNSEDATVIDVPPTATTAASTLAAATSPVGSYPISLSAGSAHNYSITVASGTLSVSKASLVASADNQSRVYGSSNPTLTLSYSGFVNGENASVIDVPPTA